MENQDTEPRVLNMDSPPKPWVTEISPKDQVVVDPDSGAVKADGNKLRFDLVPPRVLEDLTQIFTYGSLKYEDRNWEKGMKWSRPFAAAMRHLWAWWRGEDTDPDSGCSHLAHAMCNIAFLMEYEYTQKKYDDRPYTVHPDSG